MLHNKRNNLIIAGVAIAIAFVLVALQATPAHAAPPASTCTPPATLADIETYVDCKVDEAVEAYKTAHPDTTTTIVTPQVTVWSVEPSISATGQPMGVFTDTLTGPGGYTATQVMNVLVLDATERNLLVHVWPQGNHWVVETAKTCIGEAGKPGCGTVISFTMGVGGKFDFWGKHKLTGNCYEVNSGVDPTSGLGNWQVTCQIGDTGVALTDGVSWTPPAH